MESNINNKNLLYRYEISIGGMDCVSCADKIETSLSDVKFNFIKEKKINFIAEKLYIAITHEDNLIEITNLIENIGFKALSIEKINMSNLKLRKLIIKGNYMSIKNALYSLIGVQDVYLSSISSANNIAYNYSLFKIISQYFNKLLKITNIQISHLDNVDNDVSIYDYNDTDQKIIVVYDPKVIASCDIIDVLDKNSYTSEKYNYINQMQSYVNEVEKTVEDISNIEFSICLILTIINLLYNTVLRGSNLEEYLLYNYIISPKLSYYIIISLIFNLILVIKFGLTIYYKSIKAFITNKSTGMDTLISLGSVAALILSLITTCQIFDNSLHSNIILISEKIILISGNISAAAAVVGIFTLGKYMELNAKKSLKNQTASFMSKKDKISHSKGNEGSSQYFSQCKFNVLNKNYYYSIFKTNSNRLIKQCNDEKTKSSCCIDKKDNNCITDANPCCKPVIKSKCCSKNNNNNIRLIDPGLVEEGDFVFLEKGDFLLFDVVLKVGEIEVNEGITHGYDVISTKKEGDKIKSGSEVLKIKKLANIAKQNKTTININHHNKQLSMNNNKESLCSDSNHITKHCGNNSITSCCSSKKNKEICDNSIIENSYNNLKIKNTNKIGIVVVEKVLEDCLIFKLTEQMTTSLNQKLKYEHFLEKIVKYFVPVIIIISALTFLIWLVLLFKYHDNPDYDHINLIYISERSISILVVSCPCAFGLAIPMVTTTMLKIALDYGILIKNLSSLPELRNVKKIFLDKTGTLTETIKYINIEYNSNKCPYLFTLIELLEKNQTHPIAEALYRFSINKQREAIKTNINNDANNNNNNNNLAISDEISDHIELVLNNSNSDSKSNCGKVIVHSNGIESCFTINKKNKSKIYIGNKKFLTDNKDIEINFNEELNDINNKCLKNNLSVVYVAVENNIAAIFSLDTSSNVRNEAKAVITYLQGIGLDEYIDNDSHNINNENECNNFIKTFDCNNNNNNSSINLKQVNLNNSNSNIIVESFDKSQNSKTNIEFYILSGDSKQTVIPLGKQLSIPKTRLYAEKSSENKQKILSYFKSKHNNGNNMIMMVGDGINDVLSLSEADYGVSFNANSQLNLISGDVVFIKEDLSLIITLIQISRYTYIFIWINVFWAFFYNIIMIPFTTGFFGEISFLKNSFLNIEISPTISSLSQLLSDMLIILTAFSLNLFKFDKFKSNDMFKTNEELKNKYNKEDFKKVLINSSNSELTNEKAVLTDYKTIDIEDK